MVADHKQTPVAAAAATAGPAAPGRPRRRRAGWAPAMFLAPFGVLFALFFLLPIGYAVYQSLLKVHVSGLGLGPSSTTTVFAGFANYTQVFSDSSFWQGVGRVLLFGVVQIPVMLAFATVLALLVDSAAIRFRRFFRLAFFLPYGIPGVIAAILWSFLYLPGLSPIVATLQHTGFGTVNFLGANTTLWSIANIVTWEYTGYNMLIIYAGLQAIPTDLYESARLDGASEWKVATRIKLPMVTGALVLTGIFSIIGTLQLFSEPQVLRAITSNISSSYTPNLLAYTQAFTDNNPNYAAAIAVVLAAGTFILSFGFLKLVQRRGAA
ncbi:MAG TPA: sugar ABC transporter permease [Streptosporangiaceae bacterium]|jgi:multiple sugar transport system permease protein|nr:sugar ABC transporter permease [Streptosporangiaceae bacterium]